MRREPQSTYRLQITPEFTLRDAARWLDYLDALGADWVYLSPLLQAAAGSNHGYDVVDHSRTDAARGGRAALADLAAQAHRRGRGVLVDIVPNHVGVAVPAESLWWWDVLLRGPGSAHAAAFDIDWAAGGGAVLLPVLGDGADELAALRFDGAQLAYYEHRFPIAEGTRQAGDSPQQVHERQHYRLICYRRADTDLNYRRFFAVNSLAAIRVEDPAVLAGSHAEIARWIDAGWVDGLRVDHPDGLADPAGYLRDLAALTGGRYTVVEKILESGEELPAGWACDGTTGYDALAEFDRVLVDPAGQAELTALDTELRGGASASWPELTHDTRRAVADGPLGSEMRRLARLVPGSDGDILDAIAELTASFAVYRTYRPETDAELPAALRRAREQRPDLAAAFDRLQPIATDPGTEFAMRLQQTSGAVMAKGVEDCAFYRYPRLASLTEVGADPSIFAVTPAEFHESQGRRQQSWPHSMTALSTHDTKRGEDVRARIHVLAEIPAEWAELVRAVVARTGFPDGVLANLLLQTAVGAWPLERERMRAYALKAAREAGVSTRWIDPDAAFERQLRGLVDALFDDPAIQLTALADRIRPAGWSNSLSAKLIQLTAPGVPDVYRGTELWSTDLVDPDNRRPFDALAPGGAAELLARLDAGYLPPIDGSGAAKLLVTSRALRLRRDRPELFTGYRPVPAQGPAAGHLLAIDRGGAIALATRLPVGLAAAGGWRDSTVTIPAGSWRDVLTGRPAAGPVMVADVLARYPVALLTRAG